MVLKSATNNNTEILPTWNKKGEIKPGDKLAGYYVRTEHFATIYGEGEKYIIADDAGNEYIGVMAQAVLKRAFAKIPAGCWVEITYKGEITGRNGQTIKAYDVDYDDEKILH